MRTKFALQARSVRNRAALMSVRNANDMERRKCPLDAATCRCRITGSPGPANAMGHKVAQAHGDVRMAAADAIWRFECLTPLSGCMSIPGPTPTRQIAIRPYPWLGQLPSGRSGIFGKTASTAPRSHSPCEKKYKPCCPNAVALLSDSFSHPDCHCRLRNCTGSTVPPSGLYRHSNRPGSRADAGSAARRRSGTVITAGRDFHPAPKETFIRYTDE